MRTTSKSQPNQVLAIPTKETVYKLIDEMILTDYSGKHCVSKTEIKHIHLKDTLWTLSIINN